MDREKLNDILIEIVYTFCNGQKVNANKVYDKLIVLDDFIIHNKIDGEEKMRLDTAISLMSMTMARGILCGNSTRAIELLNDIKEHLNTQNKMER